MVPEPIVLPVGPTPGWEIEEANKNGTQLKSVSDSLVILHALKQSREKWLNSNFALFSSHVRGSKLPDVTPPPHTSVFLGQCDIIIGPTIFHETSVFEVRYNSSNLIGPASTSVRKSATAPPTPSGVVVTPDLLAQVNAAASTDPTLARLLQLAATGQATSEQIRMLGTLIQQLASTAGQSSSLISSSSSESPDIDFVIEYRERPGKKFLIPRKHAVCEKTSGNSSLGLSELLVTIVIYPPPPVQADGDTTMEATQPVRVKMELKKVPSAIANFVERWADPSKREANIQFLEDLAKNSSPVYLAHQIPEGPLLTQLQAANASPFVMRSLNPNNNPPRRMRRKVVQLPGSKEDDKRSKASAGIDASKEKGKGKKVAHT